MSYTDVEIEVPETWPRDFHQTVAAYHDLVLAYHAERKRIDKIAEIDVMARVHRPPNPYSSAYNSLVDQLDNSLTQHRIIGYHCTRLTLKEITRVKSEGLRILSEELIHKRLDECVADGHISLAQRDFLKNSQSTGDNLQDRNGHRTGMVWLCPNRSTLRRSGEVYRLFRSWGGEAVYAGQEEDKVTAAALAGIGTPAIVKCAVPFPTDASSHPKFAARFLSQSVATEDSYPEPSPRFSLSIRMDIPPSQVVEVIQFADPRFESLTRSSTWAEDRRINPR